MAKRTWFSAAAGANGTADIAIYDEIGLWGVTSADFRDALGGLGEVKAINLRLNSPGGDVFDGIAIHNMLQRHSAEVVVTVDGLAASVASLIAMAGDQVIMPENSMMMVHNPFGIVQGTASDMRGLADALDKIRDGMVSSYAAKTKLEPDAIVGIMDAETWLTAHEAVAQGFADKIEKPVKISAKFDLSKYGDAPKVVQERYGDAPKAAYDPDNDGDDDVLEAIGYIGQAVDALADAVGALTGTGDSDDSPAKPAMAASFGDLRDKSARLQRAIAALPNRPRAAADHPPVGAARESTQVEQSQAAQSPDPAQSEPVKAKAITDEVVQIAAACQLAGFAEKTAEFLGSGKSLAQVTSELQALKADRGRGAETEINAHNNRVSDYETGMRGWAKTIDKLNARTGI